MKNIVIFGATSAIAQAVCRVYAADKNKFYLVARNAGQMKIVADDLKARGAFDVRCYTQDLADIAVLGSLVKQIQADAGKIDIALIAHGALPDQKQCQRDWSVADNAIKVNALSPAALISELANIFEEQKYGSLVAIASVAGDRGRKSIYVYGASKGFVSIFMQGVRHRLASSGVQVLTVKPGFIDTPMTAHFKKGLLWAKPEVVAKDIVRAIEKKKDKIYTPWFWNIIMLIISHLPEFIFKKTNL